MKVKVTFAVTLSESGQRNALIAGTNAATKQTVVHELDPTDPLFRRAEIDQSGQAKLAVDFRVYGRTAYVESTSLDDIRATFAAIDDIRAKEKKEAEEKEKKEAEEKEKKATLAEAAYQAFLADPDARGEVVDEYYGYIRVAGVGYTSRALCNEIKRRNAADADAAQLKAQQEREAWILAHGSEKLKANLAHGLTCNDTYKNEYEAWMLAEQAAAYPSSEARNAYREPIKDQPAKCGEVDELQRFDDLCAQYPELKLKLRWLVWEHSEHSDECAADKEARCYGDPECGTVIDRKGRFAVGESERFGMIRFEL